MYIYIITYIVVGSEEVENRVKPTKKEALRFYKQYCDRASSYLEANPHSKIYVNLRRMTLRDDLTFRQLLCKALDKANWYFRWWKKSEVVTGATYVRKEANDVV